MMKQSGLLRWTQNNRSSKNSNRNWIHSSEALQRGHIAYVVKFLGSTEVEQAKGIDVVKEGIRKLKFTHQLKRAEGTKPPKVELTISVDGVAIQEPKTKVRWPNKVNELTKGPILGSSPNSESSTPQRVLHQYPLHRISYCADDKSDKKFFSFIAKEPDQEKHTCFVFVSDKLAEEITLTIGQAFDLAYRRFLETSGKDLEIRKQLVLLQKKVQELEAENHTLKQRISEVVQLKDKDDVANYKQNKQLLDLLVVNGNSVAVDTNGKLPNQTVASAVIQPPPIPPRPQEKQDASLLSPSEELFSELQAATPTVGTKLENLILDELEDFNPRTDTNSSVTNGTTSFGHNNFPHLSPPPQGNGSRSGSSQSKDLFGANPFVEKSNRTQSQSSDLFGMEDFSQVLGQDGKGMDDGFTEMLDGFSRGLSFGNDDFSLESLDPLNKTS